MKNPLFSTLIILLIFWGCETENAVVEVPTPTIYESCCGTKKVQYNLDKANVYIPNAFTPNGDGVSDYFYPIVNDEVLEARVFTITSAIGDTVIFRKTSINYNDLKNSTWNGTRVNGDGFFESNYVGLFNYTFNILNKEKKTYKITGTACAIQCGKNANVFQTKEGCFYPEQAGNDGLVDKTKKNNETKCF